MNLQSMVREHNIKTIEVSLYITYYISARKAEEFLQNKHCMKVLKAHVIRFPGVVRKLHEKLRQRGYQFFMGEINWVEQRTSKQTMQ